MIWRLPTSSALRGWAHLRRTTQMPLEYIRWAYLTELYFLDSTRHSRYRYQFAKITPYQLISYHMLYVLLERIMGLLSVLSN